MGAGAPGPARGGSSRCRRSTCPATARTDTPVADVTLDAYADTVCSVLAEGQPAVLVGHSMGGVVITQAAAPLPGADRAGWCTWPRSCPADGQSLLDLTQLPEGAGDQVQANLVVDGDPPVATMPPEPRAPRSTGARDDEAAAWAVARRGPQPVAPFGQPVRIEPANREAFEALPRAYVTCLQDRAIPPALQRRMFETRRLRSGDRDRHRPRTDAVAHRRDARGARPARPVTRTGDRAGRLTAHLSGCDHRGGDGRCAGCELRQPRWSRKPRRRVGRVRRRRPAWTLRSAPRETPDAPRPSARPPGLRRAAARVRPPARRARQPSRSAACWPGASAPTR